MTSDRINILMAFCSEVRGGCEDYALAMGYAMKKHYGSIAVAFPLRNTTHELAEEFKQAGAVYFPLPIAESGAPDCRTFSSHFNRFRATLHLIEKLEPRCCFFITPSIQYMLGSMYAAAWLKIPAVVCFQYVQNVFHFTASELRYYQTIKPMQSWIAVSEQNKSLLQASFHLDASGIHVVQNGVDIEQFQISADRRLEKRKQLLIELGLPMPSYLFVTVGAIRRQKGYDLVSKAFQKVARLHENAHWLWIGEGIERNHFSKLLKECNLSQRVHLLGYRRDVPDILPACDCFVFPTRYEGQPFALLEAMAAGLPVITSDASGILEIVKHEKDALVFRRENISELSSCLIRALAENEQMHMLADAARERVLNFSRHHMVRQTLSIIDKQINESIKR